MKAFYSPEAEVLRTFMRAKLHRATLTGVNLNYVGSLTLDSQLMDQLGMMAHEQVQVLNINTGARLITYLIPGERGSGIVALNGAAARLAHAGDKVLVVSYAMMDEKTATDHEPTVVLVDEQNRVTQVLHGVVEKEPVG
jgi:aspartate 1-decarboxylase